MRERYMPVIFDLEGTLVDTSADLLAAARATASDLGVGPPDERALLDATGVGLSALLQAIAQSGPDQSDHSPERTGELLFRHVETLNARSASLYPGIEAVLRAISGVPSAMVTNAPRRFAERLIEKVGLDRYIAVLVAGGDTERPKPAADPVNLARTLLSVGKGGEGLDEESIGLLVGDTVSDLQAGAAAGLVTCGVTWGLDRGLSFQGSSVIEMDHCCDSPKELLELLEGRPAQEPCQPVGREHGPSPVHGVDHVRSSIDTVDMVNMEE